MSYKTSQIICLISNLGVFLQVLEEFRVGGLRHWWGGGGGIGRVDFPSVKISKS